MKLSYNWLKNYIDLDINADQLSILLTDCGLEVESMEFYESIKGGLKGIKVGEVISCEKHPNADKLSLTTIDVGAEKLLPIVCGAPNVAKGQKVLVATIGAEIFTEEGSFKITKSKIRGEESEGMICAEDELQLGNSHDGIMVLNKDAKIGVDASEYFNVETDYIFEIGLTPNRADATSHIGSARDLVAVINRFYPEKNIKLKKPSVDSFKIDNTNLPLEIEVKNTTACPRYSGVCIENIEIKESPEWLKNKLKAIGLRPINNVVDITNFVLMETGQPLHAFDYDKINGKKINVQTVNSQTKFTTLDGVERLLGDNDLMICNAKEPMCIAGVFGGLESGISKNTKNIFLESAYFNPVYVRKTSKKFALKTDASFRFERGADPNITVYALKRAAIMLKEIAGGKIASQVYDIYPEIISNWNVELRFERLNKIIGKTIDKEIVKSILTNLDIKIINENKDSLNLEIPTFKVDVTREIDVIEEVLRIYGYNNIGFDEQMKSSISHSIKPDKDQVKELISELLVSNGFNEIMNNSLTKISYYEGKENFDDKKSVKILNPLSSELNSLRQSLVFGGLEVIKRNINFKNTDLKLFEFGNTYILAKPDETKVETKYNEAMHLAIFVTGKEENENWKQNSTNVDFYTLKLILNKLFSRFGINTNQFNILETTDLTFSYGLQYNFQQKEIATLGKLSQLVTNTSEINQEIFCLNINFDNFLNILNKFKTVFSEISKYPSVRRDLALLVNKTVTYAEIKQIVEKIEKKLLKSINLFDVYEGKSILEGKKSYAISMIFQDDTKTLTDKVIDKITDKVIFTLEKELGAKLR